MRINISAINLYRECPQKWFNRYVLLREPPPRSLALQVGTMFHVAMQEYLNLRKSGVNHEESLSAALNYLEAQRILAWERGDTKLAHEIEGVKDNFAYFEGPQFYSPDGILMVEEELELPIGEGIILVGRPDAVVLGIDGRIYHLQHKAMMLSISLSAFNESRRLSPHELGYKRMIERKFPDKKYGGTIMNVLKKGGIPGPAKLSEEVIPLSETDANDFIESVRGTVASMQLTLIDMDKGRKLHPTRNGEACFKNNSLCVYNKVCLGKASIADSPFIDVPEAYPKKGE